MEKRTGLNRAALSLYERGVWFPPDYEIERLEAGYGAAPAQWWPPEVRAQLSDDPVRATDGVVYVGRRDGLIKIGTSTQVDARVRRQGIELIATLPGGERQERELHTRFAHLRAKQSEWFREEGELADFVAELEGTL